jgi:hypothetical protein
LQPGVRTVSVIVSNPLVPQGARRSNQAPFMLIPTVNPATLAYGTGPPRSLTIQGARLVSGSPSGETVIGRSVVPRAAYINSSPTQLQVPIPDTLPARNVPVLVSGTLPDPVVIGVGAHTLDIDINATIRSVTANLPNSVARDTLPAILAALIHDAKPPGPTAPIDRRFLGARVSLWNGRLIVVPGELSEPIKITSPGGLTFANALHLTDPQPPGAGSASLSGVLDSPPLLSSANPGLTLTIGVQPAVTIAVPKTMSLAALAVSLQNAINVLSPAIEYAGAIVATSGSQLLVIPGAAGTVTFGPTTVDSTTVVELQLHAMFAVRVRVNGADTIDDALVELPQ